MTAQLTLISHHLCPYVQRAAIALHEKGVPFERVDIDLAKKPDWFLKISPLGKVPLLRIPRDGGEAILFESTVICEYLEETQAGPKLHPSDPLARARHRGWMEFGSAILSDLWVYETTQDGGTLEAKAQTCSRSKFATVEAELDSGPYFSGGAFSLVDAVFAPIFRYFDVFDRISDHRIFDGLPRVTAWREVLAERPSVKAAVAEDYPQRLTAFLEKHEAALLKTERAAA